MFEYRYVWIPSESLRQWVDLLLSEEEKRRGISLRC